MTTVLPVAPVASAPAFSRMVSDAEAGRFDVLVCESIDRLGRKLADVADLFDRLAFGGIQVHATSIGLLTAMHDAASVRRGHSGHRLRQGFVGRQRMM